jgi:ABC-2 type transport system ATP-binding protein
MVHDPGILILDEPTIGLDPVQIRETRALIRELAGERTVILSTHILPEAEMVCGRVLLINRGRLVPEEEIARARASSGVLVEATGEASAIEKALAGLKGVRAVRRIDRPGSDAHRFEIEGESSPEAREGIARALGALGAGLRELRAAGADLEEAFVRITAGDRQE